MLDTGIIMKHQWMDCVVYTDRDGKVPMVLVGRELGIGYRGSRDSRDLPDSMKFVLMGSEEFQKYEQTMAGGIKNG